MCKIIQKANQQENSFDRSKFVFVKHVGVTYGQFLLYESKATKWVSDGQISLLMFPVFFLKQATNANKTWRKSALHIMDETKALGICAQRRVNTKFVERQWAQRHSSCKVVRYHYWFSGSVRRDPPVFRQLSSSAARVVISCMICSSCSIHMQLTLEM